MHLYSVGYCLHYAGDSEELRSHTAAVPSDGHDCSPKFVAGVGLSLPRTQHYGNPSTATVDGSLLSGQLRGQDDKPYHENYICSRFRVRL